MPQQKQKGLENIPKPYRDVAKGMETQFAKLMIEQMNKTVDKTESQSSAAKYYQSLTNQKRAELMASGDGLGLQKVILDQIYPKHLRGNINQKIQMYKKANNEAVNKGNSNGIN